MRPRLASLLFRRIGGVWTPVTRQPDLSTLCWSTSSTAATVKEKRGRLGGTVCLRSSNTLSNTLFMDIENLECYLDAHMCAHL